MIKLNKSEFRIGSDEDEIRVDGLCRDLLKDFHRSLLERGIQPQKAGSLAHSADYFLRDYVVSARRENIFDETVGLVRRFAATWYIISNLEPVPEELEGHLEGVAEFYRFLHSEGLISRTCLDAMLVECKDFEYFRGRIESFWDIKDDGYLAWERECTLKRN